MKRRGVLRRSAVAGLALVTATTLIGAASGGIAMAKPSSPQRGDTAAADLVKDRYIVVLKDGKASPDATHAKASSLTGSFGGSVRQVYTGGLKGFSAQLTEVQAKRLGTHADVSYVEPVRVYSATDTQTNPPSWGLDRIDQTTPVRSRSYTYPTGASNVTAYVIDSGISGHPDFSGRLRGGYDFVDNDSDASDCDGHGTHVAGTLGGTTFGVAKQVNLVPVRVLDCTGSGTSEDVIAGINWVTANAARPAVANMSLGVSGIDRAVDDAVRASIASGVSYALAAGNDTRNACEVSPANVSTGITVGATDYVDFRAWFSNYGSCLDVFAPGVSITSAFMDGGNITLDGTSMAAPHVAGAAALLLSANPGWTPQQVRNAIVTGATSGAVQDTQGSSNRLLRVGTTEVARSGVGLRAVVNNRYVVPGDGTQSVFANGTSVRPQDRFDQVDAGNGYVALRSRATGKYLSMDGGGSLPLITNGPAIGDWEKLQVVNNTDGTVSFRAVVNGKYVSVDGGGSGPLIANGPAVDAWEKFEYVAPAPTVGIKAVSNGKYVSVGNGGPLPLIAEGPAVDAWEKFEIQDAGNGNFALKALVNGKYVSADDGGGRPPIANGPAISDWEELYIWNYVGDGGVIIAADVNLKAVTTPNGGASPLIASQDFSNIGPSEVFYIEAVQP